MSRFCSNCGSQIADNLSFCTSCGTPVKAAEQTQPDLTGTLAKKDNTKTMWIVAVIAQILCILLFLMPTIKLKVTIPSEVANMAGSGGDIISSLSGIGEDRYYSPSSFGEYKTSVREDIEVINGNFRYMNIVDVFSTEAYHTILLVAVIVALGLMIAPLIKKKEFKPVYALYMLGAQGVFLIFNIIMIFVINGKPISVIKRAFKMIAIDGISGNSIIESIVDSVCDIIKDCYKFTFSVWGWIYIAVSVLAIAILGKIVLDNKDELFGKFLNKKKDTEQNAD